MGQKKTSQNKSGKYRAVPKGNGKGKSTAANKRDSGKSDASLSLFIMPVVLVILAIVVAISLISGENSGVVGRAAARVLFGLFARCAYLIPVYLFMFGVFYRRLVEKRALGKRAVICTGGACPDIDAVPCRIRRCAHAIREGALRRRDRARRRRCRRFASGGASLRGSTYAW